MKRFLAMCLIICVFLLSACTPQQKTDDSKKAMDEKSSDQQTEAQKPEDSKKEMEDKKQGTDGPKIFEYRQQPIGTADKHIYGWQKGDFLLYLTDRALLKADHTLTQLQPDLAQEYSVSEDGLTYTFVLKDGLKWSDGTDLTAKDVEFSIKTALKVSIINGIFPENLVKIEGARDYKDGKAEEISGLKIDGNTITIKMAEKSAIFANIMAQFVIYPEHMLKDQNPLEMHNSEFFKKPVTSGMYMVKEINAGNYEILERNPNYDGKAPSFDQVRINFVEDPILAVQDGKSYFYATNKPAEIGELEKVEGIEAFPVDVLFYRYFIANLSGDGGNGNSLIADPKVREAILYAVDYDTIGKSLFQNVASASYTGVPTEMPEFYQEATKYKYDPEKAKQLLKEANYDSSKTLKLAYYYKDQASQDFMQAVSYQLEEAGIKNEVIQIQNDATTELFKTRKYDIAYKGFSSFGYESWYGEYTSNNSNFKNIYNSDTSFDELTAELIATIDPAARKEILVKLQKLEQETLFKLPIYTFKQYVFINTSKVLLPEGAKLGNPFYIYDYKFEDWDVK